MPTEHNCIHEEQIQGISRKTAELEARADYKEKRIDELNTKMNEMDKKLDISNSLSEICNHDIFKTNSLCDSDKILICLNMLSFLEKDTCLFLLNKLYENDKKYFVNTQNNNEFSKNNSIFSKIKFSIFNRESKSNNTIKYKGISGIDKLQMISKALNDKINDMRKQHISMDKCNDDYNTCFVNNIPQIVSSENLIELNNILDNLHQLKNDRSGRTFKEKYLYKPGDILGNISRKEDTYNSSHTKSQDDYIAKYEKASCCKVLVVNGNGAFLLRSPFFTSATLNSVCSTLLIIASTSSFEPIFPWNFATIGFFSPSIPSVASSVQYSSGLNASISASLSAMIFKATDCTRPALRPRFTFAQRSGLIL